MILKNDKNFANSQVKSVNKMKKLLVLPFFLLSFGLVMSFFVPQVGAGCNPGISQNDCNSSCGNFDNCVSCGNYNECSHERPTGNPGCIDEREWVGGSCGCFEKGSRWEHNAALCPGGPGEEARVEVKGKVMGCSGPLANTEIRLNRRNATDTGWQNAPDATVTTDLNGNYTASVVYKEDRVFKVEVNSSDGKTFTGVGSDVCTAGLTRPRHTWCQHNNMKNTTTENIDFQQTNCVAPASCQNINLQAGTLINNMWQVSPGQDIPYRVNTTSGASLVEFCFHAGNLLNNRTWSQDWHCLRPGRIASGSNTFAGNFKFSDIKNAIVNMGTGYTSAMIDSNGLRAATRVYTSENVFCNASGFWSDGGVHHGSNTCTFNKNCNTLVGLVAKQAGPSCENLTVTGGNLVSGVRRVSATTPMSFSLLGSSGSASDPSIDRNQLCFYPNTLGNKNDWSLGWHCFSPSPASTNPYNINLTFTQIKHGILSRPLAPSKITSAQIDADGFRYIANVHKPDGTFCDGGSNWTGIGSSIYNACTHNTACAGNIALATTPSAKTCSVTSPDPSVITTAQTKRINVSGNSSNSSIEPTRLILSKRDFTQMANKPPGTKEIPEGGRYYYVFQSQIENLKNRSFETGNTSGWTGSKLTLGEFRAVDGDQFPPKASGKYYLKAVRSAGGDAFVYSDWIETNGDVSGQIFTLSFMAKSQSGYLSTNKISGIMVQRFPLNCIIEDLCINPNFSAPSASFGDIDLSSSWKSFSRNVVFPNPGNGSTTSRVRVVLRLPNANNIPIYYDNISLSRANNNTFNCSTSSSVTCLDSVTLENLPVGEYNAYCDLATAPGNCTGSPACIHEGCTGAHCIACSGTSCSDNDNLQFTVESSCVDADPKPVNAILASAVETNGVETTKRDLGGDPTLPTQVPMPSKTSQIKLYWNTPDGSSNTKYEVVVYKHIFGQEMTAQEAYDAAKGNSSQAKLYTVNAGNSPTLSIKHPPSHFENYRLTVAIRAINDNTCAPTPTKVTSWSKFYFDMVAEVEGNFRLVDNQNACFGGVGTNPSGNVKNSRVNGGVNVFSPASGLTISGEPSYGIGTVPFTPSSLWGDITTQFEIDNSADPDNPYICASCNRVEGDPLKCVATGAAPKLAPSTGNNFYLLRLNLSNDPWWQAVNGLVYGGTSVNSRIPDSCDSDLYPFCVKALVAKVFGSDNNRTAGLPLTEAGSINKGDGLFSENDNARSTGVNFDAVNIDNREDYDHFVSRVSLTGNQLGETVTTKSHLSGGITDDSDGTKTYYRNSTLTVRPQGVPITVESSEKIVIFVDGDLIIDGNPNTKLFDVKEGGYLGFIVSGKIAIRPNVGHDINDTNEAVANELPPNISGVFIAENISVESDGSLSNQDKKFIGEGTFVGWSSINLHRNFESDDYGKRFHNGNPTELFIYRPSYMDTTPNFMKTPGLLWQEVN